MSLHPRVTAASIDHESITNVSRAAPGAGRLPQNLFVGFISFSHYIATES
jgi:hypothetical protein